MLGPDRGYHSSLKSWKGVSYTFGEWENMTLIEYKRERVKLWVGTLN